MNEAPCLPEAFFTRDGRPAFTPVQTDGKGGRYCEIAIACPLCGGSGEMRWKSDPICTACDGSGFSPRYDRVKLYTATEIETLEAAARKKEARRAAELAALLEALHAEHGALLASAQAARESNPLAASILDTVERSGRLSQAQASVLERAVLEHQAGANTRHVGSVGEALRTTATVTNVVPFRARRRNAKAMAAVTLSDPAGNVLVAFSAKAFAEGEVLDLSAQIKEHRIWRGSRQTILEKVAFVPHRLPETTA